MIVPLTDETTAVSTATVGGKGSSLAKLYAIPLLSQNVPKSYALSTEFFQSWMDVLKNSDKDYTQLIRNLGSSSEDELKKACDLIKETCLTLPLSAIQEEALRNLANIIATEFNHGLAAVRSSAVEEDGTDQSYAGMFETDLGVTPSELERAVRHCFASKFDYRVFRYAMANRHDRDHYEGTAVIPLVGFAVVVMEMIDSVVAGVAFSANPLNSDRDECVIDSSYGLGESVVDGSVIADHFVYDKVQNKLVDKKIGTKKLERRLNLVEGSGVSTLAIDDEKRQYACSLSEEQLEELVRLTCIVEEEYGMPVDVEFAVTNDSRLVVLQARPITTLFWIDSDMMTKPGEKRALYYDFNIIADATTMNPFTHMDIELYCRMTNVTEGLSEDAEIIKDDPRMPMFNASTRQYFNMSILLKYASTEYFTKASLLMDPHLSSLFDSKDCDRNKYRVKKLPKGVNMKNAWWLMKQVRFMKLYKIGKAYKSDPEKAKSNYIQLVEDDMARLKEIESHGYRQEEGLYQYAHELFECIMPSVTEEMGALFFVVLKTYQEMDKKRRPGNSEQDRLEYDALCSGYEGDGLMQINIDMFCLANKLDASIWQQYGHADLPKLSERIQKNLDGVISDLPVDFLSEWREFAERYGWDGEDQMFVSSPRYNDDHVLLLARLRQNAGAEIKDPAITQREQVANRRHVMKLHEVRAGSKRYSKMFSLPKIQKRNKTLDHLMWIRNAPKLRIARVLGILRVSILRVEDELIDVHRLEAKGDIFHLGLEEVDEALRNESFDLIDLVRPRKAIYERAAKSKECPLLVDSRCRILRPDPPAQEGIEAGTFLGTPVSPGTATGRVRILKSPTGRFEQGEVLAATVTSPAWTPLFVGASAVVLRIGGALQHGALCAREFGKPAVSNIDIHNVLETGMMVAVDGNNGTVKIVDES